MDFVYKVKIKATEIDMQKKINAIEEIPGSFHTKQFKVDLEDHIPLHFLFCYQKMY